MKVEEALNALQDRLVALSTAPKTTLDEFAQLEADMVKWLNRFPDHPGLLFMLGTVSSNLDRAGIAINLLKRATETGANSSGTWINLGGAYKREHMDKEAEVCFTKAVELAKKEKSDEDLVLAYNSLAGLHVNAGRPAQCIHWADEALKISEHPSAMWNKGLALLESGQWEEGFKIYDEAGFKLAGMDTGRRKLKTYGGLPQWDGTKGKTVIVYGEQGIGDEVMLASIIPDVLKDAKVIIDGDKRLEALFRRSFPEAEAVYSTSNIDAESPWLADHKADAQISMGSLGRLYRKKDSDFPKKPFFVADEDKRWRWRNELEKFEGLKVGISYFGGHKATRQDKRSILLDQWKGIFAVPNVDFFSLQYHPWSLDDVARAGTENNIPIHAWWDVIQSYDETAAFLKELDLVITVNTSLHHLTGSLGVQQLCLCPKMIAWRYGVRGPSPWYSNCTMLRQSDEGDWQPVLTEAATLLHQMAYKKHTGKRVAA